MAPPKSFQPGFLQSQLNLLKKKKRNTGQSSRAPVEDPPVPEEVQHTEEQPVAENVQEAQEVTPSTDEGVQTECSVSNRRRGSNKNFELARQTANGEKVRVVFDPVLRRPYCKNRGIWSRHLGAIVRENNIIPHCTVNWRQLPPAVLDHLWTSVTDKFDSADDIEYYRADTLKHIKTRWDDWRYDIHLKHIRPHENNVELIRADKPSEMTQQDWEWLLEHHFFTDKFQRRSAISVENKKNSKYPHKSGSKAFTQLQREMEAELGAPPSFEEFFLATRTTKTKYVDPLVIERVDEMRNLRAERPEISNLDLVEGVFGLQNKGSILGMGPVSASHYRGPAPSKAQLRNENMTLQERLDSIENTIREEKAQAEEDRRREKAQEKEARMREKAQEKEARMRENAEMQQMMEDRIRQERADMMRMMAQFVGQGCTPEMFAQFSAGASQSSAGGQSSSAANPPVQPHEEQEEDDSEEED